MPTVTKDQIRSTLEHSLAASDAVLAFWEAGSTAMGRADQWSDLDLQVVTKDGRAAEVRSLIEASLDTLSTVDLTYEVPTPTWHGHLQVFYRLADADPLWLVDLVIMEEKNPRRFLEPEVHGRPVVYLDRAGIVVQQRTDAGEFARLLERRVASLSVVPKLFYGFVDKELQRGRPVDAWAEYHGLLARTVEALRILHCPWRYNFGLRYLQDDLPPEVYKEVAGLCYVGSADELLPKKARAWDLLEAAMVRVRALNLPEHLEAKRDEAIPAW
jgi:hypothetical protein